MGEILESIGIAICSVCKQIRKSTAFCLNEKNLQHYPDKHQNLGIFYFYMVYLSSQVLEL